MEFRVGVRVGGASGSFKGLEQIPMPCDGLEFRVEVRVEVGLGLGHQRSSLH
jgi:hypothetical protein